jgi:mono/diheme cytochrome c family protein
MVIRRVAAAAALLLVLQGGEPVRSSGAGEPEAYYTEAQAVRGHALFQRHCSNCHFAEPDPEKARTETAGYTLGSVKTTSNLGGTYIIRKESHGLPIYPSVYFLFRELESMPAVTDSISQQERTDILTYLLRQNRFPPGPRELDHDPEAMKAMPLDEPGFVRLFNGRDFSGLKFLIGLGCTPPPRGCGRTDPRGAVSVRNGVMIASGKEHGIVYTEHTYKDFTIRFDQLNEAPADWDPGTPVEYYFANTGYHFFLMPENLHVWQKAMTFFGEMRDLLKPVAGIKAGVASQVKAFTWDRDTVKRVMRPLGQWNSLEVQSKGGDMKGYLNGALVSTVTQHEYGGAGHIGIQVQGYPVRWRNIRIKEQ